MSISRVYKIVNDVDDLVYIGSTKQILCKRMTNHRDRAKQGNESKLYNHMKENGFQRFKILLVRDYNNISKERLKEDKYINIFDSVKHGLNSSYAFGNKCEHKIVRSICKECKGSQICEHNKRINCCKDCKGSSICEHNKQKNYCIDCKGTKICSHDKQKQKCKICSPAECDICSKVFAGKANLQRHQKNVHHSPSS